MNNKLLLAYDAACHLVTGGGTLWRDHPEGFGDNEWLIGYLMEDESPYNFVVDLTNEATIRRDLYFDKDVYVYNHSYLFQRESDNLFENMQTVLKKAQELEKVSQALVEALVKVYREFKNGTLNIKQVVMDLL